jgi:two-component system cell cycle response regulator
MWHPGTLGQRNSPDAGSAPMSEPGSQDLDPTLQTLDEATRGLASEMDAARLIERALHTLSDFGRSDRVALLTIEDGGKRLVVAGLLSQGKQTSPDRLVPVQGTPLEEVITTRRAGFYPLLDADAVPLPAVSDAPTGSRCLCLPLIGNHRLVIGVVTLECAAGREPASHRMQILNVVATLLAVSLENTRLFHLATVDALTGLYARRYFEIRLEEEVARIARHGGFLSLLITDIDQFKRINDQYGHQQGDLVLRELATLLRATIRKGVDLPCRYGGEEFATILPVTDLNGALEMAERVRRSCGDHRFPSPLGPITITLSGGVATMSKDDRFGGEELLRRADAALYRAKDFGRNRICAWRES